MILTLLICCVLYPLALWAVAKGLFPSQADGSLIADENGEVRGSSLIAQPFSDAKYFQPRPSAVSHNAAASGGSNLAASNPKLRGQVAQRLGLLARYKKEGPRKGAAVGPDVEKWFNDQVKKKRNPTAEWATANPALVTDWAGSSDLIKAYILDWAKKRPDILAGWRKANPDKKEPQDSDVGDLAGAFFHSFCKVYPGTFPGVKEEADKAGIKSKVIRPVTEGDEIKSYFFDMWLTENPEKIDPLKDLEQVPADLVMTSGSGLDPHITWRGAQYQLDGVVEERAKATGKPVAEVREVIDRLLHKHSFRPLGGLAGEPLVNVLEVNRDLDKELKP
jgi:K+-transporting ATPase ATPase C chain